MIYFGKTKQEISPEEVKKKIYAIKSVFIIYAIFNKDIRNIKLKKLENIFQEKEIIVLTNRKE